MSKRKLTPFRIKYLNFKVSEIRRLNKLKAIEYKGGKCEKCGYNKCPGSLVFITQIQMKKILEYLIMEFQDHLKK